MGGRCINFLGSRSSSSSSSSSSPLSAIGSSINIENRMLQNQEQDEDVVKDEEDMGDDDAVVNEDEVSTPTPTSSYYDPYRRWEEVYYSDCKNDDPYRNCTCTNIDRDNYTLSVMCGGDVQCRSTSSTCGIRYEKCEYRFYGIEFAGEEGSFSTERCFDRNDFRMCYTFYMDNDRIASLNINRAVLVGCGRKINGVLCNSCDVVDKMHYGHCDDYKNLSTCPHRHPISCFEFDCTNTALNRAGSSCDSDYRYRGSGSFYGCDLNCNICGAVSDNATMTLPDKSINIPFYGEIQCSQSQKYASDGYLTSDGCHAIQQLAIGKCGCEGMASNETVSETPPSKAAAGGMFIASPTNLMIAFVSSVGVIYWLFTVE